jgi:hypothetical protein
VESDEKIDTTRYLVSVTLNFLVMFLSSKAWLSKFRNYKHMLIDFLRN